MPPARTPAGQCCCDRCHAAGWSILFYSGVEVESFDVERWLPARGFEDHYEVSTHGRVRNRQTGRILAASGRYPSVRLGGRTVAVHQLMGETFLGGPWPGQVVLHDDDDKTNNWIANLRFGNHSDNLRDAHRHGARKRLCPSGRHRLAGANVFIRSDGVRVCMECVRERARCGPRFQRAQLDPGAGPVSRLSDDDVRAAYYCASEVLRGRRLRGQPVPPWLAALVGRLDE